MIRTRVAVMTLALISIVTLDACKKKQPPQVAPAPVAGPNADSIARARAAADARMRDSIAAARRADSLRRAQDAAAAAAALANAALADAANLRATLVAVVNFEFDQSDLRDDARAALDAKARILQANPGVMIRIAGHTDERGSDEYNLALGQRRAATAKKYLVDRGVADGRIQTVSYGEERPVSQGSDESAWGQNRRAEFEITSGGQPLKKP